MYGGGRRKRPVSGLGVLFFEFQDVMFYGERSITRPNPNLEDFWREGCPDTPRLRTLGAHFPCSQ